MTQCAAEGSTQQWQLELSKEAQHMTGSAGCTGKAAWGTLLVAISDLIKRATMLTSVSISFPILSG